MSTPIVTNELGLHLKTWKTILQMLPINNNLRPAAAL